jgi:DNA polymerase I-like protein with 3'-5' exonuclease and polymerase domains
MDFPEIELPVPGARAQYQQSLQLASIAGQMKDYGWLVDRDAARRHMQVGVDRQAKYRTLFSELSGIADLGKDGQGQTIKDYFWKELKAPPFSIDKDTKKPKLDKTALIEYCTNPAHSEQLRKCAASLYGFRRNGKVMGYMESYLELSKTDGRVHPSWNIWGTKTSRWSCNEPNIQQLSGRAPTFDFGHGPEELVEALKDILVADPGFTLVGADWSALELYIQTYIAQAQKLLGWMAEGKDLHMENAKAVLGPKVAPADANKKTHKVQREVAKLFFGFAYNGSDNVEQVFKQMKDKMPAISLPLVKRWRAQYFRFHDEFPSWQESTKRRIGTDGFIDTPLMERRLYLHDSMRGYNQGLNGQAQITAGDLANIAILRLAPHIDWKNRMLLAQVHDSFITQCRPDDAQEVGKLLTSAMCSPVGIYGIQATFQAEPDAGPNWQNMGAI